MRIPKYTPYVEPAPRRRWTRDELLATVRCVRDMVADEQAGRDPRRLERIRELMTALGRELQTVRLRLGNVVHVLATAGLPVPACVRPMPGVGTRIASAMLDAWHALDAEDDLAAFGPVQARRPWTAEELEEALGAVRRMGTMEARLGRSLTLDEAGDIASEAACQLGRRWSETRRVMAALAGLADGPGPRCLKDVKDTTLTEDERGALERLLRNEDATTA